MASIHQQPGEIHIEDDLKLLSEILEEIVRYSGDYADKTYQELKKKAETSLQQVKTHLNDMSDGYCQRAKQVADKADIYLHDNPWYGVGIGATVGLVLGVLLAKK
ncbi:DUF883 domain-containing protein [Prodigiosinella aquatilis]|nr:DUF883 domain-containing protein [Prodigiosinella sp. LS101]WJV52520.1 DUF883 domain-containing protein [Prodigiosinella sp. LS101]WJV56874.1 DUF883 domain-containing protein [Pectobacteriaceae bacterium C111]